MKGPSEPSPIARYGTHRTDMYADMHMAKEIGEAYVVFYNYVRPHHTLAHKIPSKLEELYGKEKTQDL